MSDIYKELRARCSQSGGWSVQNKEVIALLDEIDRLREAICISRPVELHGDAAKSFVLAAELSECSQELERYKSAEKEGRLFIWPYEPGSTVFYIDNGVIVPCVLDENIYLETLDFGCGWSLQGVTPDDIGRKVFPSRDAANAALGRIF